MAEAYKVLGQANPGAVLTNLYDPDAGKSAVVSTIIACNRSGIKRTCRIAVSPAGVAIADAHYIAYDLEIAANDLIALTIGATLAASDELRVYGSTADVSFTAFGTEIS